MDQPVRRPRSPFVLARVLVEVTLLIVITVGLGGVVLGRVLPAFGHPVLVVAGPSMEPTIPIGSAVILASVDPAQLAVGDVVSLRSGPERAVFTHRITQVATRDGAIWIETRGDANAAPDPSYTPASAVLGRVTMSLPWIGYVLTLLSAPVGILLVLSVGATLMVLGWFLESLEDDRRRRLAAAPTPSTTATPAMVPDRSPAAVPALGTAIVAAGTPSPAMATTRSRQAVRRGQRLSDDAVAAERRRMTRTRAVHRGAG